MKTVATKRKKRTHHKRSVQKPVSARRVSSAGEMRQDLVTGKWVVVAVGRAKRFGTFSAQRPKLKQLAKFKDDCPFCHLDKFPQKADVVRLPDNPDEWLVHVFPNKYPAFLPKDEFRSWNVGPYRAIESVGYHEVLATRWHHQIDASLSQYEMLLQIDALLQRYQELRQKPSVTYIQIIKNHGPAAGGSLEHPHHQILTVPVLPSDIRDMLFGAERYGEERGQDPFTIMMDFEREAGDRIVLEDDHFVAFCPYASRVPFEVWLVPKAHDPYFENITQEQRESLAEMMRGVLARLYTGLNDPPYNYYLHSAPCDETGFICGRAEFPNFRWHVEILPRLNLWGGFELGTGLEITSVWPEKSAAYLREVDISNL